MLVMRLLPFKPIKKCACIQSYNIALPNPESHVFSAKPICFSNLPDSTCHCLRPYSGRQQISKANTRTFNCVVAIRNSGVQNHSKFLSKFLQAKQHFTEDSTWFKDKHRQPRFPWTTCRCESTNDVGMFRSSTSLLVKSSCESASSNS